MFPKLETKTLYGRPVLLSNFSLFLIMFNSIEYKSVVGMKKEVLYHQLLDYFSLYRQGLRNRLVIGLDNNMDDDD